MKIPHFKNPFQKSERGQAIILIAFAIVGLVAMVGLMTDTGLLLIEYGRLKRGIDAASISAALQFREGFSNADLENAAKEFLRLNQADVFDIQIDTCGTDVTMCTTPQRKLVKVTASRHVQFGFLRVLGIESTDITAQSVGEAASIDLVFVMDTSASMAFATSGDPFQSDPGDDPSVCNASSTCEPLESIKTAALSFLDTIFFPYDRVAIVTMTSQVVDGTRNPVVALPLSDNETNVRNAISALRVFQPPVCDTAFGPCLNYPGGSYAGLECPIFRTTQNPSTCTSSNIGGGLLLAGSEFSRPPIREDSFWVVILLAGGPANATDADPPLHADGYCPPNTWNDDGDRNGDGDVADVGDAPNPADRNPFCRDAYGATRHGDGDADYDADDYARDMADFLADPDTG
jgi:hypothetical protein